jgi:succinoglycan biosynthesis protein ExoW
VSGRVTVIIPYYQEKPGILRGAVMSVILQENVGDLEIIVVDDGSPAPARADLQGLDLPAHVTLKLIEQPNRGPGAARNRALDDAQDTLYIAFLDSDDRWTGKHLINARSVLDRGYDVYFADRWHSARNQSFFQTNGLPKLTTLIQSDRALYRFLDRATLTGNALPTSCVVYRSGHLGDLRFVEDTYVGEDRIFWRDLNRRTDKIAFSTEIEAISGHGIHICQTSGWGTPRAFWKLQHYLTWHKWLDKHGELEGLELRANATRIKNIRQTFVLVMLHELKRGRLFKNPYFVPFIMSDPISLLYAIPMTLQVLGHKLSVRR